MSKRLRCYKIRVETPYTITQNAEVTWAGLSKKIYVKTLKEKWKEFGRRHKVDVKVDVKVIPCSELKKVRNFLYRRKRKRLKK